MEQIQYQIKSKVGPLYLVASRQGLRGVFFCKQNVKAVQQLNLLNPVEKVLAQVSEQLEEYFAGKRQQFELNIDFAGTAFQKKVWQALSKIPFGQTVSYRDIAQKIKNPKAVRAVGSANGKNPFCIIIPCHRVIAANGTLGGYSGGLAIKRKLLKLEGGQFK